MSENQKIKELLKAETPKDRVKFRIEENTLTIKERTCLLM